MRCAITIHYPDDLAGHFYPRFCAYYLQALREYPRPEELPESVLTQCVHQVNRLRKDSKAQSYEFLATFFLALFPVLSLHAQYDTLEQVCEDVLAAYGYLQKNPTQIYHLRGQIHVALGKWDQAEQDYQQALQHAFPSVSREHGEALLALGRLKFNRGDYVTALRLFDEAQKILEQYGDKHILIVILGEKAALHLNRGHFRQALRLYEQIEQQSMQMNEASPDLNTGFMLGVVHRKLRRYSEAERYLSRVLEFAERFKADASVATSLHHLGWVYVDQKLLDEAQVACQKASEQYAKIGDMRGLADAYEQSGEIAFLKSQADEALQHLEKSLSIRTDLKSQQGSASSLKRLAKVHLSMGHLQLGMRYFWRCVGIYHEIGGLNAARVFNLGNNICTGLWRYLQKRLLLRTL